MHIGYAKEANVRMPHIVWFQLSYGYSEETKTRVKQSVIARVYQGDELNRAWSILGQWNCIVLDYNSGYMSFSICQNRTINKTKGDPNLNCGIWVTMMCQCGGHWLSQMCHRVLNINTENILWGQSVNGNSLYFALIFPLTHFSINSFPIN